MIDLFNTLRQHPEHFKQLKCKDVLFTQYDCPQEKAMQDLFSQHNYIAYALSGKRVFYLPGEIHAMTEGKCVFVKKGAWIAEKEMGVGWCVLVFFIPDNYLKQFVHESRTNLPVLPKGEISNYQVVDLEVNRTTKSFFESMIPYFDQAPPIPEALMELKFKELLFNLLINPSNKTFLSWLYTIADSSKQPIQSVMEANYTFNLSLNDYAKIANRSLASFKREFQDVYHTSPGKWLVQKRLEYARMLLLSSSKSISEITFESGFENATHFSRLYKLKYGDTPSQSRAHIHSA
jgi:AraC-like DNA-binding protein